MAQLKSGRKKKSDCNEKILSNTLKCQSESLVGGGYNFSSEKEDLFKRRFEEGYDLQDEEYSKWLEINHPLPISESFQHDEISIVSALMKIDESGNNHSSSPVSSPKSLHERNSSIHSSSDKENINTNLDTPDPVSCASPLYSSIVSVQSTVANSASVSSPAKRLPLASVTNLLPGDTPK